jgi:hypothetical protein
MAEAGSGIKSSEFKLSAVALVVGTGLDVVAAMLSTLAEAGVGGKWVAGAMLVCGLLLKVAAVLGYTKSRTLVKLAEAAPVLARDLKEDVLPLGPVLRELLEEIRAGRAKDVTPPTPPASPST